MKIAFVAAFAAIAGYGVYANQKVDTMSDLMLAIQKLYIRQLGWRNRTDLSGYAMY